MAAGAIPRQIARERRPHDRLTRVLLAFAACLLAANAVLAALYIEASSKRTGAPPTTAAGSVAIVYRFYEALNGAIATGSSNELLALLHPDFAEEPARAGVGAGRDGLLAAIDSTRAIAPGLRIAVESVAAASPRDELIARLRITGADNPSFLGLAPVGAATALGWGPIESVGVVDGLIGLRRTWHVQSVTMRHVGEFSQPPAKEGLPCAVGLLRLVISPGSALAVRNETATRAYVVDAGELSMSALVIPDSMEQPVGGSATPRTSGEASGADLRVRAGGRLLTKPGEAYVLANHGDETLVLMAMVVRAIGWGPVAPANLADVVVFDRPADVATPAPEIAVELLALAALPTVRPITLALGQIILPPGVTFGWERAEREVLIAVDHGVVDLVSDQPGTIGLRANGQRWAGRHARLAARDGAQLGQGTSAFMHTPSDAFASIYVLAIGEVEPKTTNR